MSLIPSKTVIKLLRRLDQVKDMPCKHSCFLDHHFSEKLGKSDSRRVSEARRGALNFNWSSLPLPALASHCPVLGCLLSSNCHFPATNFTFKFKINGKISHIILEN